MQRYSLCVIYTIPKNGENILSNLLPFLGGLHTFWKQHMISENEKGGILP